MIWRFYLLVVALIGISHWLTWHAASSNTFYLAHLMVGGTAIGFALYIMLKPVYHLFWLSSTFYHLVRGSARNLALPNYILGLVEQEVEAVRSVTNKLEDQLSFINLKQTPIAITPFMEVLGDVKQLMVFGERVLENTRNWVQKSDNRKEELFEKRRRVGEYFRTKAQLELADSLGAEIHGFVVCNLGLGAVYYGIWGYFNNRGIQAFDVSTGISTTLSDFLYYSVITVTTIGYGDITPRIWQTQLLVASQAIFGVTFVVGIIGVLLSLFNSDELYFLKAFRDLRKGEEEDIQEILHDLKEMDSELDPSIELSRDEGDKFMEEKLALWKRHRKVLSEMGID